MVHIARIVAGASGELWGVGNVFHAQQRLSGVGAEIQQGFFLHEHQGAWTKAPAP